MDTIQLLEELKDAIKIPGRIFAIEWQNELWCVGLKREATFTKEGEIEIWTNWVKSVSLVRAVELFADALPDLVVEGNVTYYPKIDSLSLN